MRTRTTLFLLTAVTVLVIAAAGVFLFHRHALLRRAIPVQAGGTDRSIRLPFALPCSTSTGDVGPFYAALRRGDRASVTRMLAANKVYMIRRGVALSIMPEHPLAIITIDGDPDAPPSCFIPADVVPAIERKAYR